MPLTPEDITGIILKKCLWVFLSEQSMYNELEISPWENRYARLLNRNGLHICWRSAVILGGKSHLCHPRPMVG